jgi:hypothetical protein
MHHLAATLHLLGARLAETAQQKTTRNPERGGAPLEVIPWAIAALAIYLTVAAILVAALQRLLGFGS